MFAETLIIGGGGYVGATVASILRAGGGVVSTTSRRQGRADLTVESGAALDRVLGSREFSQIVHLPQLTDSGGGWALDRVDGPRWLVFSSAQLGSQALPPGSELARAREDTALDRGATVLRPTMIFGRGGDVNVSRMIRFLRRYRCPVVVGSGNQLVQPVHVDDVAALVVAHGRACESGLFPVGASEQLRMHELVDHLRRALGLRLPLLLVPSAFLRALAHLPLPGVRPDQLLRSEEDKVVDISPTCEAFDWSPQPLLSRLDEAVDFLLSEPGACGHQAREITSA